MVKEFIKKTYITGEKKQLWKTSIDDDSEVLADSNKKIIQYPPEGHLLYLKGMRLFANSPSSATTGFHSFELSLDFLKYAYYRSSYATDILLQQNTIILADKIKRPSSDEGFIQMLGNIIIDENTPLIIDYRNSTDVSQLNGINVQLIGIKEETS